MSLKMALMVYNPAADEHVGCVWCEIKFFSLSLFLLIESLENIKGKTKGNKKSILELNCHLDSCHKFLVAMRGGELSTGKQNVLTLSTVMMLETT